MRDFNITDLGPGENVTRRFLIDVPEDTYDELDFHVSVPTVTKNINSICNGGATEKLSVPGCTRLGPT
jgi:hypothetical protein